MKVVVITPPEEVAREVQTIKALFEGGLEKLHIRKPGWSDDQLSQYIERISEKYFDKISIHQHPDLAMRYHLKGIHHTSTDSVDGIRANWNGELSRSTHSIREIAAFDDQYDYYFLSPVFDSISKQGYSSNLDLDEVKSYLRENWDHDVIALGGIDQGRIDECRSMGFDGVAILGAVWQQKSPAKRISVFNEILKITSL